MEKGAIFKLESFATKDGDGIRYGIFLSGCPLSCHYCHNPECKVLTTAIISSEELIKKVLRYKPYFSRGGGATFSGGEPLLQAKFICEAIEGLQKQGVGSYIDTSGNVKLDEDVKKALKFCDGVLLDLKFTTEAAYKRYCGGSLAATLKLLDYLEKINKSVFLRTVIVGGINDTTSSIEEYYSLIKSYSCVKEYLLLPFHTLGFSKYEKYGLTNHFANKKAFDAGELIKLQNHLDKLFLNK